jgi:NAD(P)-dependent dehydrogenase (short-subunit alcohol dehydrogenase family)
MTAQKILLITGSSRGIGAATARLAAAQGYDVAVNYTRDKEGAAAVVADIEKAGRRAVAIQADVGREGDVARLFATIDHKLGRLTDLVYNAGITGPASRIENLATDAAREILDINVLGAVLCARAAIPLISTAQGGAGGAIVLLSSAMATLGGAGEYVMYSASKGAVESLSTVSPASSPPRASASTWSSPARPTPASTRPAGSSGSPKSCRWGGPALRRRSPRR